MDNSQPKAHATEAGTKTSGRKTIIKGIKAFVPNSTGEAYDSM